MARKPKPELAIWLIDQRKAHGESVGDIARVTDRTEATVRGWEAGRPPSADDAVIAHLERHWGAIAPQDDRTITSNIIDAIDRNTEMLRAVLDALIARLPEPLPPEAISEVADAIVEGQAATVQAEKTLRAQRKSRRRRTPGPGGPAAGRRSRRQPDGLAG